MAWHDEITNLFQLAHARGMSEEDFDSLISQWVGAGGYLWESARLFLAATDRIDVSSDMLSDMLQRHRDHAKEIEIIIRRKCGLSPLP